MAFPILTKATWVGNSANPVTLSNADQRRADSAAFAGSGSSANGAAGGVVRHADDSLSVTVSASDNVTIQPGAVVIPGNAAAGSGVWLSALPAVSASNALSARDSTNSRVDLVVFRAMDADVVSGHAAYMGRIEVLAGTPSATPDAPALPAMAVELARITVPATGGATASVDSSYRKYAAALGAEIPVASSTRLPVSAVKWQRARVLDTGLVYRWTGAAWELDPASTKTASGTVTLTSPSGGTVSTTVTLPAGLFTSAPSVQLTSKTGAGSSTTVNFWTNSETAASFVANMTRSTNTATTFTWTATGY